MKLLHPNDTMTAEERLQAVINLQVPDRVPVAPFFYYFNAFYNGNTYAELYNPKTYYRGLCNIFDELAPWDINYHMNFYDPEMFSFLTPMKMLEPGRDLPADRIRQFVEAEIMKIDDYEWLTGMGKQLSAIAYFPFIIRLLPRLWDTVPAGWKSYPVAMRIVLKTLAIWITEYARWRSKGVTTLYALGAEAAFDTFSMTRGMIDFIRDMKDRPDEIKRAADSLTKSFIFIFTTFCKLTGINRAILALHRSSNDFISPQTFRELSFPSAKAIVEGLAANGITTVLHCDGNWELNLEILRELPAGHTVMQLDGATDIFKAKEIVGDRMCIMGDVPADMLCLASPTEIDEYCHRLIEEVGKGGGFILATGCELAPNAKPENVKAMLESVTKYGYYR